MFSLEHLKNFNLADPIFCIPHVDVLQGAYVFPHILRCGRINGRPLESSFALKTVYDWVLIGAVSLPTTPIINSFRTTVDNSNNLSSLDTTLKNVWAIEKVPFLVNI